jgi:predicted DNA-binding transcriptional regulator AlpA
VPDVCETMPDRLLLTRKEVARLLGVSVKGVEAFERNLPGFPRPVKLSHNVVRHRAADMLKWIDEAGR